MERTLEIKIEEMNRYAWPCGVLVIDVDRFKAVNDKHGHDMGDAVLRMVSRTIHGGIRGLDLAGRWGGEELMVVVSNAAHETVATVAERIRALVAASNLSAPEHISVTVSVGAAVVNGGESAAQLFRRADESLYQAKREGRNRVCLDRVGNSSATLPQGQRPDRP